MIKTCINCDNGFEGTRKQLFCSDTCEKQYATKANMVMLLPAPSKKEAQQEEIQEAVVIATAPSKQPKINNLLSNIKVTSEDKERLSQMYGKNDRRKQKCGF